MAADGKGLGHGAIDGIVPKGFVAIDGTSLTVCEVDREKCTFTFMLVGHTQKNVVVTGKKVGEKVNVEVDCTPEEARRFLGLPDVTRANEAYVDAVLKAMQGGSSVEQMQAVIKQMTPMGEMGMKLFQQFMDMGIKPKKD